jgi:hypothetical protein
MSELAFTYSIRFSVPKNPQSPASIGAKFVDTLDALSRIDPTIFTNWAIMDFPAMAALPLESSRSQIAAIIERNVERDDWDDPEPAGGYTANGFTADVAESRSIDLRIKAGGKDMGEINLETGDYKVYPDPAIVTYKMFKAALLAINAIWPSAWACAYAFRSESTRVPEVDAPGVVSYSLVDVPMIPSEPTFPRSLFHVAWFAYLSPELAAGLKLVPEILAERTPDGGLLMSAATERLDPLNSEHRRRARVLVETMIARTGTGRYT